MLDSIHKDTDFSFSRFVKYQDSQCLKPYNACFVQYEVERVRLWRRNHIYRRGTHEPKIVPETWAQNSTRSVIVYMGSSHVCSGWAYSDYEFRFCIQLRRCSSIIPVGNLCRGIWSSYLSQSRNNCKPNNPGQVVLTCQTWYLSSHPQSNVPGILTNIDGMGNFSIKPNIVGLLAWIRNVHELVSNQTWGTNSCLDIRERVCILCWANSKVDMKPKVLVLGAYGQAGRSIVKGLARSSKFQVIASGRNSTKLVIQSHDMVSYLRPMRP